MIGERKMEKKKVMNWIIAIIVAIVYLIVSFIFDAWVYSWLIWVLYATYRFIVKQNLYLVNFNYNMFS